MGQNVAACGVGMSKWVLAAVPMICCSDEHDKKNGLMCLHMGYLASKILGKFGQMIINHGLGGAIFFRPAQNKHLPKQERVA